MYIDGVAEGVGVAVEAALTQRALAVRAVEAHQHRIVHAVSVAQQVPARSALAHLAVEPQRGLRPALPAGAVRPVGGVPHACGLLLAGNAARSVGDEQAAARGQARLAVLLAHRLPAVKVVHRRVAAAAYRQAPAVPLAALLVRVAAGQDAGQVSAGVVAEAHQLTVPVGDGEQPALCVVGQRTAALVPGHVAVRVVGERHLSAGRRQRPQRVAVRQAHQAVGVCRIIAEARVVDLLLRARQEGGAAQPDVVQRVVAYQLLHHGLAVGRARQPAAVGRRAHPELQPAAVVVAERLGEHRRAVFAPLARGQAAVVVVGQAEGDLALRGVHGPGRFAALVVPRVAHRYGPVAGAADALRQAARGVPGVVFADAAGGDADRTAMLPGVHLLRAITGAARQQVALARVAHPGYGLRVAVLADDAAEVAAPVALVAALRHHPAAGGGAGHQAGFFMVGEVRPAAAAFGDARRRVGKRRQVAVGQRPPGGARQGFHAR